MRASRTTYESEGTEDQKNLLLCDAASASVLCPKKQERFICVCVCERERARERAREKRARKGMQVQRSVLQYVAVCCSVYVRAMTSLQYPQHFTSNTEKNCVRIKIQNQAHKNLNIVGICAISSLQYIQQIT